MMSASDRQRLALCGRLSPPRIAPAAIWTDRGSGFQGPAQTLTRTKRLMSATGPYRSCAPHSLSAGADKKPAWWLALHESQEDPPASGTKMASASSRVLPHVTAQSERHSPRLVETVHDPSGSGSAMMMTRGLAGGDEMAGCYLANGAACTLSPLVGEKAKS